MMSTTSPASWSWPFDSAGVAAAGVRLVLPHLQRNRLSQPAASQACRLRAQLRLQDCCEAGAATTLEAQHHLHESAR